MNRILDPRGACIKTPIININLKIFVLKSIRNLLIRIESGNKKTYIWKQEENKKNKTTHVKIGNKAGEASENRIK